MIVYLSCVDKADSRKLDIWDLFNIAIDGMSDSSGIEVYLTRFGKELFVVIVGAQNFVMLS